MPAGKLMLFSVGLWYALTVGGVMPHSPRSTRLPMRSTLRRKSNVFALRVAERVAAGDAQPAVVAPAIRIPDLVGDGAQLDERFLARVVGHPGQRADVIAQRAFNRREHRERVGLGLRPERLRDVDLAERFAEVAVGELHAALPARAQLRRPAQDRAVEAETLVHERRRQEVRVRAQQVPA